MPNPRYIPERIECIAAMVITHTCDDRDPICVPELPPLQAMMVLPVTAKLFECCARGDSNA